MKSTSLVLKKEQPSSPVIVLEWAHGFVGGTHNLFLNLYMVGIKKKLMHIASIAPN